MTSNSSSNQISKKMKNNSNSLNVIIAGSRNFDDYARLKRSCDDILKEVTPAHRITVLSGNARGADALGERYASERGYDVRRFPADWRRHGKAAGPMRNAEMAAEAQMLICFWDGNSKGTHHMIATARKRGLEIHIIPFQTSPQTEGQGKSSLL